MRAGYAFFISSSDGASRLGGALGARVRSLDLLRQGIDLAPGGTLSVCVAARPSPRDDRDADHDADRERDEHRGERRDVIAEVEHRVSRSSFEPEDRAQPIDEGGR